MKSIRIEVQGELTENIRVGDYLVGRIPQLASRKSIKKAITKGLISINGNRAKSYNFVRIGDVISYTPNVPVYTDQILLEVPYETEDMAVVVKPPGVLSSGNGKVTVQKSLSLSLKASQRQDALPYPTLMHRLDRDTCGLLLVAKSKSMELYLSDLMASRKITKKYAAIVESEMAIPSIMNTSIEGQEAVTYVKHQYALDTNDPTALVLLELGTGRTHQIRIHCSGHGIPIVGDPLYNKDGLRLGRGLFLQAYGLSWEDGLGESHTVTIPLHKKFHKYVRHKIDTDRVQEL